MTELSPAERFMLTTIFARFAEIEAGPECRKGLTDREWVDLSIARDDMARGFGVRVGADWLGSDGAGRKRRERVLDSLHANLLVERIAPFGDRRTHVKLTATGRAMAQRLTATTATPELTFGSFPPSDPPDAAS